MSYFGLGRNIIGGGVKSVTVSKLTPDVLSSLLSSDTDGSPSATGTSHVRRLGEADDIPTYYRQLTFIWQEACINTLQTTFPSHEEIEHEYTNISKLLSDPQTITLVIEDDYGLGGFLIYTRKGGEGQIIYTAVLSRRQKLGYFTKMYDMCKEIAIQGGDTSLRIIVDKNNTHAISIYRHKGFTIRKECKCCYEFSYTLSARPPSSPCKESPALAEFCTTVTDETEADSLLTKISNRYAHVRLYINYTPTLNVTKLILKHSHSFKTLKIYREGAEITQYGTWERDTGKVTLGPVSSEEDEYGYKMLSTMIPKPSIVNLVYPREYSVHTLENLGRTSARKLIVYTNLIHTKTWNAMMSMHVHELVIISTGGSSNVEWTGDICVQRVVLITRDSLSKYPGLLQSRMMCVSHAPICGKPVELADHLGTNSGYLRYEYVCV